MVHKKRVFHRFVHRPGTIYVLVLSTSVMVTVIGLAALYAVRVQRRTLEMTENSGSARLCAQAAVELGLHYVSSDTDWRTNRTNGTWLSDQTLGQGSFSLTGIDPVDGDLTNSDLDPVILTGTGNHGFAQQKIQVRLIPGEIQGLDCLTAALHVGGDLILASATEAIDVNSALVSCNEKVINSGTIYGDVDANSVIEEGTITGTLNSPAPDKEMPDDATLFTYYQSLGTAISILSIPTVSGTHTMEDLYLADTYNPYGMKETNTSGVYVIDCMGLDLNIRNSHILGTLVLLDAGSLSQIDGSVYWEQTQTDPATGALLPSLLVQGDLTLSLSNTSLDESSTPVDLNNDSDMVDTWPSIIKGLVYISGRLTATTETQFYEGTLVTGGDCELSDTQLTVDYQSTFYENPPSGWHAPVEMKIATGSWQKVVD
ncbi:hypothetical protein ACFL3F_05075 [Planctomycetota bacterium]